MKGFANLVLVALVILAVGGLAYFSGAIPGGSITGACPLLLPQYCNYECLAKAVPPVVFTDSDGYPCAWGTQCVDKYCAFDNQIAGSQCIITSEVDALQVQIGSNSAVQLNSGQTLTVAHGSIIKTARFGGGIRFNIKYDGKYLRWQDWRTGNIKTGDGCDLTSLNIGTEAYSYLPTDAKMSMNPGESQNYVCGFDEFPLTGNYANYNGQQVICEKKGDTTAALYRIEEIQTKAAGCYSYPGTKIKDVQCCPNDQFNNQVCGTDFIYHTTGGGIDTGCCIGGLCTSFNCPGEGGFDYDSCTDPPCTVYSYNCDKSTGACVKSASKTINCYDDGDCPPDLFCDRGTNTCVDKIVPVTCTQAGHECCTPGMFASNVGLKECPEGQTCSNGECLKNDEECNIWCQIMASFTLIIMGLIVGFIITLALGFFVIKPIFGSPVMFLLVWLAISAALIMVFSIPLGMVAGAIA